MEQVNIFEVATRNKTLFPLPTGGQCYVQDLWDLSIERLAIIGKNLKADIKELGEEDSDFSEVAKVSKEKPSLELKYAVVKHIYDVKVGEKTAASEAKAKKEHNDKILTLIAQKKEGQMNEMSVEDLEKLLK